MSTLVAVALGGAVGALGRYALSSWAQGFGSNFPWGTLTVNLLGSFLMGVPHDADDAAIVTAIIVMAHSLGLSVVGEGVESPAQLEFLRERGCDRYQGYLCSRPVPAAHWSALLPRGEGNG